MAQTHAAPGACFPEMEVLEESEDGLGGEEDGNNDVADDLMVSGRQSEWFRQPDTQRQTNDDEDDAQDLEGRVEMWDFLRVG
jgi:hypothetical protein